MIMLDHKLKDLNVFSLIYPAGFELIRVFAGYQYYHLSTVQLHMRRYIFICLILILGRDNVKRAALSIFDVGVQKISVDVFSRDN